MDEGKDPDETLEPELKTKLQDYRLKQFVQRVAVFCHLSGLSRDEVEMYIKYRLAVGGTKDPEIFVDGAIDMIASFSQGIPRIINLICDAAMVYGFADNKKTIDRTVIEEVIRERSSSGIFDSTPSDLKNLLYDENPIRDIQGGGSSEKLEMLEARVDNLETMLNNIDKRLEYLMNIRDEKDTVVLELFKLLKNSMENRYNTLMYLAKKKSILKN